MRPYQWQVMGRRRHNRLAILKAFLAKSVDLKIVFIMLEVSFFSAGFQD
jgi:hypothetical protein